ncbi:MAG: LysR family transcriptional regulator [Proteobacteria bacterium]|nr:LysR family transcriptional regulator [Pseudomonadota bacterium]
MNRFESMHVLLAVVDAGSLSEAARRLGMPLATVSRKVAQLEGQLKARLLIRSTRQLKLTDVGREYVVACQNILNDVHEAERAVSGEYTAPRGDLVIAAPVVFGRLHVLPTVCEFLKVYPEVNVRLVLGDRTVNLVDDQIDAAVRIGELPDSSLITSTLGSIRRIVCASPAYVAEHGIPRHPRDLSVHRCITFESLTGPRTWQFRIGARTVTVPVRSRLVVTGAEAAVDAAICGLGLACVLSYQAQAAIDGGKLTPVLQPFEPAPLPVSLLHSGRARLPLKLRALLDFAAPRLRARLQAPAGAPLTPAGAKRERTRRGPQH